MMLRRIFVLFLAIVSVSAMAAGPACSINTTSYETTQRVERQRMAMQKAYDYNIRDGNTGSMYVQYRKKNPETGEVETLWGWAHQDGKGGAIIAAVDDTGMPLPKGNGDPNIAANSDTTSYSFVEKFPNENVEILQVRNGHPNSRHKVTSNQGHVVYKADDAIKNRRALRAVGANDTRLIEVADPTVTNAQDAAEALHKAYHDTVVQVELKGGRSVSAAVRRDSNGNVYFASQSGKNKSYTNPIRSSDIKQVTVTPKSLDFTRTTKTSMPRPPTVWGSDSAESKMRKMGDHLQQVQQYRRSISEGLGNQLARQSRGNPMNITYRNGDQTVSGSGRFVDYTVNGNQRSVLMDMDGELISIPLDNIDGMTSTAGWVNMIRTVN